MKRILLAFLVAILAPGLAQAQSTATPVVTGYLTTSGCSYGQTTCFVQYGSGGGGGGSGAPYIGTPLGFQQITGMATSTALTVPTGATYAVIATTAQAVTWRDDGVAPTATVGYPLLVTQNLTYSSGLANIRFIQATAGAVLNVSYYK